MRVGQRNTYLTSLRTIESAAGYGVATYHVVLCYLLYQLLVGHSHVWRSLDGIPVHVLLECLFHLGVADLVAASVVVEQTVKTYALDRCDKCTYRRIWLQTAAGADADASECAVLFVLRASIIVDVGQRVEFGHDNVDIVTPDTMTLTRDAFSFIRASDGMELSALYFKLDGVEMCSHGIDAGWIAHEDDFVSQIFRTQVKVET